MAQTMSPGGNEAIQRSQKWHHSWELREKGKRPEPPGATRDGDDRVGASVPSAVEKLDPHFIARGCEWREAEIPAREQMLEGSGPARAEVATGVVVDDSAYFVRYVCHFSKHGN
jgi:hypothetical protein